MSSKIASDGFDNLTDHLAAAFTAYSDAALAANDGEPVNLPEAIILAGRNVRAGLDRLAEAIESARGASPGHDDRFRTPEVARSATSQKC